MTDSGRPLHGVSSGDAPGLAAARFYAPVNAFRHAPPAVPVHVFLEERDAAFAGGPSRLVPLDLGSRMGMGHPATTPNVLASYVVLAGEDPLAVQQACSGSIYYVLSGTGVSTVAGESCPWGPGDVLALSGGASVVHRCDGSSALLLVCTDEPLFAYLGAVPGPAGGRRMARYPAAEIDRELVDIHERDGGDDEPGKALLLSHEDLEQLCTTTPTLTAAINTLAGGADQRAHVHNAAAITLAVDADDVYSVIDGQRLAWEVGAVVVTPPTAAHSHHNVGTRMMRSFVVQDSGAFYHSRAVGFSFVDQPG